MTLVDAICGQSFLILLIGAIAFVTAAVARTGYPRDKTWHKVVMTLGITLIILSVLGFSSAIWINFATQPR